MKRPMHWYWAALASFLVAYAVLVVWLWLCIRGSLADQDEALLEPVYRGCFYSVRRIAPWAGNLLVQLWYDIPFFLAAVVTYEFLRCPARSEPLRCLKCDHILKGLS
jgi:hypothetical protein